MRAWNSTLPARRAPLRAKKPWNRSGKVDTKSDKEAKKRTPMKRVGKRTAAWDNLRAKMKVEFERAGITRCEANLTGCTGSQMLSMAHPKKRRNLVGAEMEQCALFCLTCHDKAEVLPESEMTAMVRGIIAARETPVRSVWKG